MKGRVWRELCCYFWSVVLTMSSSGMGFATSRSEARQLVKHGHFLVERQEGHDAVVACPRRLASGGQPRREVAQASPAYRSGHWRHVEGRASHSGLEIDKDKFARERSRQMPVREDITLPIDEQLIVELYSR